MDKNPSNKKHALALFSGGLDSVLAVLVAREAGAEVTGITFTTPFFGSAIAEKAAKDIDLPLIILDIFERHLEILKNPRFGYGKNLNPCIDCHALMAKVALETMHEKGCDFLITGEVLGERPKSQNKNALFTVSKQSGAGTLLVRPLSAKLLPETQPEADGWIDREKLLDISGRGRKRQIELAEKYLIKEFATPAGGCLLTDPNFSNRLKRVIRKPDLSRNMIELLKVGRHFVIDDFHTVVSRNKQENEPVSRLASDNDIKIVVKDKPSPVTVVLNGSLASEETLKKAAALTLRYSKYRDENDVALKIGDRTVIISKSLYEHDLERF